MGRPRAKAIDDLCAIQWLCIACLKQFTPSRRRVSQYRRGKEKLIYCSGSCRNRLSNSIVHSGHEKKGQCAKQEHHVLAKFYCIKSPDNVEYKFRNLENFVRTHAHLFPAGYADTPLRNGFLTCHSSKAARGLRKLFCPTKSQAESYLGWVGVWKKDRLGKVVWERASKDKA